MTRKSARRWVLAAVGVATGWTAYGQTPTAPTALTPAEPVRAAPAEPAPGLLLVRQPTLPPETTPPTTQPAPVQPAPVQPAAVQPPATGGMGGGMAAPPAGGAIDSLGGGALGAGGGAAPTAGAAQTSVAPNVGGQLATSDRAVGVEVQQRNTFSFDPRVRGLRIGQYLALGDGVPYFPARLDLDTPVSNFDPLTAARTDIVKGPFTTLLGPGFGFLNVITPDTLRADPGKALSYGGTTAVGYQTNGGRVSGTQLFHAEGQDFGFRGSYRVLEGSDYRDGAGNKIPASFLTHNVNFALGYDLSPSAKVEFKALRTWVQGAEYPGLFFDIGRNDIEAYNLRFDAREVGPFDLVTGTLWYNASTGTGTTQNAAKQTFVNNLLQQAFSTGLGLPPAAPGTNFNFRDTSTSRFAERSIGYRLLGQWGNDRDQLTIRVGHDLNVFGQGLVENIRFQQIGGALNAVNGQPLNGAALPQVVNADLPPADPNRTAFTQTQRIPESNSVNPGLFYEAMLPVEDRFRIRTGGRMDWVHTSSNQRQVVGNFPLFGSRFRTVPLGTDPRQFDPIILSVGAPPVPPLDPNATDPTRRLNPPFTSLDRDFYLLNGFVTGEFNLSKEAILFVGYGYAERAPTLTELYAAGPFIGVLQQGTTRLFGDPNLSKERMHHLDVGLRYSNDWVRAGVSGFYALVNDYITYDATLVSSTLGQLVFTNTDLATLAGTEMYLNADLTSWLTPFASLSFVQGVDQTHADRRRPATINSSRRKDPTARAFAADTEPLPQIPPMDTRLGFRVHESVGPRQAPRWQVEFLARVVNGQNNIAQSLGELPTPGFTTYTISGFYQVRPNWLLTAGVENIGDILYREHLDPIASTVLRAQTGNPAVAPLYRPGTNFFVSSQLTY
jgi:outer membrane receptor protein involved in Fe transport